MRGEKGLTHDTTIPCSSDLTLVTDACAWKGSGISHGPLVQNSNQGLSSCGHSLNSSSSSTTPEALLVVLVAVLW